MAKDAGPEGSADDRGTLISRLSQMSARNNLLALDATLRAVREQASPAAAAAEVRSLSRRMIRTANDFAETLPGGALNPHIED